MKRMVKGRILEGYRMSEGKTEAGRRQVGDRAEEGRRQVGGISLKLASERDAESGIQVVFR
jgi:hypothetical protein